MALTTTWPLTSDGAGAVEFTANQWRTLVNQLFTEGVFGSGFIVSERSAGANMNLDISAGVGVLQGDDAANQGRYLVREDTATGEAVTIATANPSNPRHDLVGIQLRDPSEGGAAGRDSVFAVVPGTAAASPADPAVPDSFLVLARVVVGAGVTSILDAYIQDLREPVRLVNELAADSGRGWVDIDSGTINAAATTTISFPGGYRAVRLTLNGRIVIDGSTQLWVRPNGFSGSGYIGALHLNADDGTAAVTRWTELSTARVAEWGSVFNNFCEVTISSQTFSGMAETWNIEARSNRISSLLGFNKSQRSSGRVQFATSAELTSVDVGRLTSDTVEATWTLEGWRS